MAADLTSAFQSVQLELARMKGRRGFDYVTYHCIYIRDLKI